MTRQKTTDDAEVVLFCSVDRRKLRLPPPSLTAPVGKHWVFQSPLRQAQYGWHKTPKKSAIRPKKTNPDEGWDAVPEFERTYAHHRRFGWYRLDETSESNGHECEGCDRRIGECHCSGLPDEPPPGWPI
jgi:hypothetical protein